MRSNPIRIAASSSAAAPAEKAVSGLRRGDAIPVDCFHSAKRGCQERVFRRSAVSAHRPVDVGRTDTLESAHGAGGISPRRRMRAYSPGSVGAKRRYLTAPGGPYCALFSPVEYRKTGSDAHRDI